MGTGMPMQPDTYYYGDLSTFPVGKGSSSPSNPDATQSSEQIERNERIFGHKWASYSTTKKD